MRSDLTEQNEVTDDRRSQQRRALCILLLAAFSAMLGMGIIAPFLPQFARQHGANGFWMGMIFAGFGISRGIIMPFIGRMSDKRGRKIFVATGLLIYAVISLGYPLSNGILMLTIVRLIHGLAAGMIMPIVMAYVGDIATKGKESTTTAFLNMMFYLGLASGPVLGGIINKFWGFDQIFYVMSFIGACAFFMVLFFLPENKDPHAAEVVTSITFTELFRFNFIKAVLIIAVVCALMLVVFISFMPSLALERHLDTAHIGMIISLGIFFAGILQIPFGKVADKLDTSGKFLQIGVGTTIGMMALLVMPFCPNFGALLAAGSFLGIGASISTPVLTGFSVSIGQRTGMGRWMGIYQAATSLGFVCTPLIAGIIMDHLGVDAVFYLLAMLAFFGSLIYIHFIRLRLKGYKT